MVGRLVALPSPSSRPTRRGVPSTSSYTYYVQGSYILFWLLALALSGVYTKNTRPAVIARSMAIATLVIGFFYGLLPEGLRFSRALLLLGGLAGITMLILWRSIIGLLTRKHLFTLPVQRPRMLFLGSDAGRVSLQKLLTENGIVPAFFLQDMVGENEAVDLEKLEAKIQLYNINECVVESSTWPASVLMQIMSELGTQTNVKSLVTSGPYIVGSNSSLNQGETYGLGQFNVADANYRRQKRLLDITLTLLHTLTSVPHSGPSTVPAPGPVSPPPLCCCLLSPVPAGTASCLPVFPQPRQWLPISSVV